MRRDGQSRDDARDDASGDPTAVLAGTRGRCCPSASAPFTPAGRQVYCTAACRQQAYRSRVVVSEVLVATPTPPQRGRREVSVYECPDCDQAYLGQQWCPDCQRPCVRLGVGGTCPHCLEPVSIDQLLTATP